MARPGRMRPTEGISLLRFGPAKVAKGCLPAGLVFTDQTVPIGVSLGVLTVLAGWR